MKRYKVIFDQATYDDLIEIYNYLAPRRGNDFARQYIDNIYNHCLEFDIFPERGTLRNEIRQGLRVVGYKRKIAIAFRVKDGTVSIMRILYNGQNLNFDDMID